MANVRFRKPWSSPADRWGDRTVYPAGWIGDIPDHHAGFTIALGIAEPTSGTELPAELVQALPLFRQVVAHFRAVERVEPTLTDVAGAIERLASSVEGAS